MKKLSFIFTMLLALVGLQANAAIYIVGGDPFLGWDPSNGIEMTDNGDGTYSYTTTLTSATTWFVFADGLSSSSSDWDTFNNEYRYGPTTGSDVAITVDTEITTQKQGNGSGSYKFTGTVGNSYTFTFDLNNLTIKISGKVDDVTETSYTVAGNLTAIFGTSWDVTNTDNDMVKGSDGIYTLTKTNVTMTNGTTLEFKVAENHDWGTAYPSSNYSYTFSETAVYTLVFTFDPTTEEVGFTATKTGDAEEEEEGDVTYNVAGSEAAVFGTTWDPANTDNDMTLVDGIYTLTKTDVEMTAGTTLEFKVVKGHEWGTEYPSDNYSYTFETTGTYTLVFTFNAETKEVGFTATLTEQGEEVDPITGKLYILGQVNDNNWNPSTGIEMTTTDEDVYTLTHATFSDAGDGYAYFSFTSKLGENENDWSFGDYRRGAVSEDYEITDEMLGSDVALEDWGSTNAFKVAAGVYDVTVYLSSDKIVLTKYNIGDVNHDKAIDVNDVTALIGMILGNGTGCPICGEVNGDGAVDVNDVTALIGMILGNN